jgi:carboxypeptidase Q
MLLSLSLALAPPALARKQPEPLTLEAAAAALIGGALTSSEGWEELTHLCVSIGHRLTGSEGLERAVDWTAERMAEDGLEVRKQEVPVQLWTRGEERLTLLAPAGRELGVLGLGWTVGTPPGGVEGEVLVVDSFEHLQALGAEAAEGRIVLFDVPFTTYGETVAYRRDGPGAAEALGAVAALVRSVSPVSLYTPHTGTTDYKTRPGIPAAAVTLEDAAWLRGLQEAGTPARLRLELGAADGGEGVSHNVIGEIPGRERPEEVVVLGCHLDSWDVGQGAQDDGFGCAAAMEAGRLIAALDTPPRRTVRVVLYTNEESGLAGARIYAEQAAAAGERHVAAIESDSGGGAPAGFRVDVRGGEGEEDATAARRAGVTAALAPAAALLTPLEASALREGFSGADIGPLVLQGAVGLGVDHDTTGYWPIHHTRADTLDKVDPDLLRRAAAIMAVMGYAAAEIELP